MARPKAIDEIIRCLKQRDWLAVHEFQIIGHSQTALSARLRELARLKMVSGRIREGVSYKEWALNALPDESQVKPA